MKIRRIVVPMLTVAVVAGAIMRPRPLRSLPQQTAVRSFDQVQLLEDSAFTSASASIGDIDHDGDLDIILAKGRHWPLNNLIFRNDGKGHFTKELLADAPDRTYTAALADLNGDGHLDLVVSNDRPDRKLVYVNDGTGHFRLNGTFA